MDEPDIPDEDYPDDEDDDIPRGPFKPMGGQSTRTRTSTPIQEGIPALERSSKTLMIDRLYKVLEVDDGDADTSALDYFRVTRDKNTFTTMLEFRNKNNIWETLTRQDGEFRSVKEIKTIMGGIKRLTNMLGLNKTPAPLLEDTRQAVQKLRKDVQKAADYIDNIQMDEIHNVDEITGEIKHVDDTLEEASKEAGLPVRELLGLNAALQRSRGALIDNIAKLNIIQKNIEEIHIHITKEENKFKHIENDSSYTDQQRDEVKKRLEKLKNDLLKKEDEHSVRLEAATLDREAIVNQLEQTIENIPDSEGLRERIKTLFKEQGVTIVFVLTAVGMMISTIILAIKNTFGIKGGSGSKKPPSNDPNTVKNWVKGKLKVLARLLKKLGVKALSSLPAILGSVISWVLNMFRKVVELAARYTYAFITFIATIIGYWIYEQVTKS